MRPDATHSLQREAEGQSPTPSMSAVTLRAHLLPFVAPVVAQAASHAGFSPCLLGGGLTSSDDAVTCITSIKELWCSHSAMFPNPLDVLQLAVMVLQRSAQRVQMWLHHRRSPPHRSDWGGGSGPSSLLTAALDAAWLYHVGCVKTFTESLLLCTARRQQCTSVAITAVGSQVDPRRCAQLCAAYWSSVLLIGYTRAHEQLTARERALHLGEVEGFFSLCRRLLCSEQTSAEVRTVSFCVQACKFALSLTHGVLDTLIVQRPDFLNLKDTSGHSCGVGHTLVAALTFVADHLPEVVTQLDASMTTAISNEGIKSLRDIATSMELLIHRIVRLVHGAVVTNPLSWRLGGGDVGGGGDETVGPHGMSSSSSSASSYYTHVSKDVKALSELLPAHQSSGAACAGGHLGTTVPQLAARIARAQAVDARHVAAHRETFQHSIPCRRCRSNSRGATHNLLECMTTSTSGLDCDNSDGTRHVSNTAGLESSHHHAVQLLQHAMALWRCLQQHPTMRSDAAGNNNLPWWSSAPDAGTTRVAQRPAASVQHMLPLPFLVIRSLLVMDVAANTFHNNTAMDGLSVAALRVVGDDIADLIASTYGPDASSTPLADALLCEVALAWVHLCGSAASAEHHNTGHVTELKHLVRLCERSALTRGASDTSSTVTSSSVASLDAFVSVLDAFRDGQHNVKGLLWDWWRRCMEGDAPRVGGKEPMPFPRSYSAVAVRWLPSRFSPLSCSPCSPFTCTPLMFLMAALCLTDLGSASSWFLDMALPVVLCFHGSTAGGATQQQQLPPSPVLMSLLSRLTTEVVGALCIEGDVLLARSLMWTPAMYAASSPVAAAMAPLHVSWVAVTTVATYLASSAPFTSFAGPTGVTNDCRECTGAFSQRAGGATQQLESAKGHLGYMPLHQLRDEHALPTLKYLLAQAERGNTCTPARAQLRRFYGKAARALAAIWSRTPLLDGGSGALLLQQRSSSLAELQQRSLSSIIPPSPLAKVQHSQGGTGVDEEMLQLPPLAIVDVVPYHATRVCGAVGRTYDARRRLQRSLLLPTPSSFTRNTSEAQSSAPHGTTIARIRCSVGDENTPMVTTVDVSHSAVSSCWAVPLSTSADTSVPRDDESTESTDAPVTIMFALPIASIAIEPVIRATEVVFLRNKESLSHSTEAAYDAATAESKASKRSFKEDWWKRRQLLELELSDVATLLEATALPRGLQYLVTPPVTVSPTSMLITTLAAQAERICDLVERLQSDGGAAPRRLSFCRTSIVGKQRHVDSANQRDAEGVDNQRLLLRVHAMQLINFVCAAVELDVPLASTEPSSVNVTIVALAADVITSWLRDEGHPASTLHANSVVVDEVVVDVDWEDHYEQIEQCVRAAVLEIHRAVAEAATSLWSRRAPVHLVLANELHGLLWEGCFVFRHCAVDCVRCLVDMPSEVAHVPSPRAPLANRHVGPASVYYVCNPNGDLPATEKYFYSDVLPLLKQDGGAVDGWCGRRTENNAHRLVAPFLVTHLADAPPPPSVFLYMGHGGGDAVAPRELLYDTLALSPRHVPSCVLLMGCCSARHVLSPHHHDPIGGPMAWLQAGAEVVVGSLMHVGDADIDRLTGELLKVLLESLPRGSDDDGHSERGTPSSGVCLTDITAAALSVGRRRCRFPLLTGAVTVCYSSTPL